MQQRPGGKNSRRSRGKRRFSDKTAEFRPWPCSPDGAKRNPGTTGWGQPRISLRFIRATSGSARLKIGFPAPFKAMLETGTGHQGEDHVTILEQGGGAAPQAADLL